MSDAMKKNAAIVVAITNNLRENAEQYHTRAIGHDEFTRVNHALWAEAESFGVADAVRTALRDARETEKQLARIEQRMPTSHGLDVTGQPAPDDEERSAEQLPMTIERRTIFTANRHGRIERVVYELMIAGGFAGHFETLEKAEDEARDMGCDDAHLTYISCNIELRARENEARRMRRQHVQTPPTTTLSTQTGECDGCDDTDVRTQLYLVTRDDDPTEQLLARYCHDCAQRGPEALHGLAPSTLTPIEAVIARDVTTLRDANDEGLRDHVANAAQLLMLHRRAVAEPNPSDDDKRQHAYALRSIEQRLTKALALLDSALQK